MSNYTQYMANLRAKMSIDLKDAPEHPSVMFKGLVHRVMHIDHSVCTAAIYRDNSALGFQVRWEEIESVCPY